MEKLCFSQLHPRWNRQHGSVQPGDEFCTNKLNLSGPASKRRRTQIPGLDASSESETAVSSDSPSSEEGEDAESAAGKSQGRPKYKIPKVGRLGTGLGRPWNQEEMAGFRKLWPGLTHVPDSAIFTASRTELANMGRGRAKESKVISTRQIKNYERACAPVRVEAGFDECAGTVHSSRFLRGFIGDPQELWLQARTHMEIEGLSPITNYEMGCQGIGDLLTTPVWEEIHNPGSRLLCLQMLSPKSVETALRNPDKSESPKLFDTLGELKTAVITLDTAILRVMPWNHAFRTLALYLVSTNYGDSELGGKTSKVQVLTGFVNEVMLQNAKAWVEKRKYFSHQDLVNKWPAFMNRSSSVLKTAEPSRGSQKKQKHTKTGSASGGGGGSRPTVPKWVCKKFNQGDCKEIGDKHDAYWDPNFSLKHVCSKILADGKCCLKAHAIKDHK